MIPRPVDSSAVISSFCAEIPTQQVYIITGTRGVGKTVFMTELSKKIAAKSDWVVFELNPESDLLWDLASKMSSRSDLTQLFKRAKINLSFFGFGVEIKGVPAITNMETAISKMLQSLKKEGRKVLITIDEVSSTPSIRTFVHAYQIFVRNDLPVFLLMTGLYDNINTLQNEKSLTFLYRAPKIELKPLNIRTIADHYGKTFQLERAQALEMASITKGYSFAFQVLGYYTWEREGAYKDAVEECRRYLEDYSYDKIWSELSAQDKRIAYGTACSNSGKIAEIRQNLSLDTNHFNPYRKRLIRKGILNGDQYGYLFFVLPFFREYVLENYEWM